MHIFLTTLAVIALFLSLTFVHEFGHLITAKVCHVEVKEFTLGMGPRFFKRKIGETEYSLRLFPIGGFCKIVGENGDKEEKGSFASVPWWQKIAILAAGSIMNFLFAVLLFSLICFIGGKGTNVIEQTIPNSPAVISGLLEGDRIVEIADNEIRDFQDINSVMSEKAQEGKLISVKIERKGEQKEVLITPKYNQETNKIEVGIILKKSHNPIWATYKGMGTCIEIIKGFPKIIKKSVLLLLEKPIRDYPGPVVFVTDVGSYVDQGVYMLIIFASAINLCVGLANLLPFPALDGGRIAFVIFRKVTGNIISDKVETVCHVAGFVILMAFTAAIFLKDALVLMGLL